MQIRIDKNSNFTHKGGGNKTIEINARYYLLGKNNAFDVIDRGLELQMLPAMVFANGTEQECRDWVLRNTEEPQERTKGIWTAIQIKGQLGSSSLAVESVGEGIVCELNKFLDEYKGNAALILTSPALLALLEQYHKSFPTKESGKLIAQAKGWI